MIHHIPPTKNTMVRSVRGQILEKKQLADMTDGELNRILTSRNRVTQDLVNQVHQELERRQANKEISTANADLELREEVIDELVASGIARHVAANFTNTQAKLLAKAREIGYI